MNIYQRVILISGAIALAIAIWTTPKVLIRPGGGYISYDPIRHKEYESAAVINPITASIRGGTVLGVTALVFFAFKGTKNKKKQKGGD
jgi:hypothetical protein